MTDWIITLPKTIKWEDYQKELDACSDGITVMNYRLPRRVYAEEGDRCFVTWNGFVRGSMDIRKVFHAPHGFVCSTTGKRWPGGWYLERGGFFWTLTGQEFPYPGFRGIRRFPESDKIRSI